MRYVSGIVCDSEVVRDYISSERSSFLFKTICVTVGDTETGDSVVFNSLSDLKSEKDILGVYIGNDSYCISVVCKAGIELLKCLTIDSMNEHSLPDSQYLCSALNVGVAHDKYHMDTTNIVNLLVSVLKDNFFDYADDKFYLYINSLKRDSVRVGNGIYLLCFSIVDHRRFSLLRSKLVTLW